MFVYIASYEAVMVCDRDCMLGGGELIVLIPRDAYKEYPTFIGSEWTKHCSRSE